MIYYCERHTTPYEENVIKIHQTEPIFSSGVMSGDVTR